MEDKDEGDRGGGRRDDAVGKKVVVGRRENKSDPCWVTRVVDISGSHGDMEITYHLMLTVHLRMQVI